MLIAVLAVLAMVSSMIGLSVGMAAPASALEATSLSPATVDPGSTATITVSGTDFRLQNSLYQFQFDGFSGLTPNAGACPNISITTSLGIAATVV